MLSASLKTISFCIVGKDVGREYKAYGGDKGL